jgi:hypothetical protein
VGRSVYQESKVLKIRRLQLTHRSRFFAVLPNTGEKEEGFMSGLYLQQRQLDSIYLRARQGDFFSGVAGSFELSLSYLPRP